MKVGLLTIEQKEQLKGVEFIEDNKFNPIQDLNNNWVISIEEVDQCNIDWVKDLPLIDYKQKKVNLI